MYERRSEPILLRRHFLRRMAVHLLVAAGVVALSLVVGTLGYEHWGKLSAIDSFLNAAMLLGGMGSVVNPDSDSGKLFAAIFALYAGLVFIAVATLTLAPVLHRILHRVHLEDSSGDESHDL